MQSNLLNEWEKTQKGTELQGLAESKILHFKKPETKLFQQRVPVLELLKRHCRVMHRSYSTIKRISKLRDLKRTMHWRGIMKIATDINYFLDRSILFCYSEIVKILRAFPSLRRDAERGVLVLGHMPECLSVARLGAVLVNRNNTRAFYLPEVEKTRRYHHV